MSFAKIFGGDSAFFRTLLWDEFIELFGEIDVDEQRIFLEALEKSSAKEVSEFLSESCGDDLELRERVEVLLRRHNEENSFLQQPAGELAATCLASAQSGISSGHLSVLKSIGRRYGEIQGVLLADSNDDREDPVVRPSSAQIPDSDVDSRYQLFGEIARGGMGAIIKGRDADLGRELAVKVLLDDHKDKPEVVQRFVEEAQIGGQLQHPGIAPVYELGQFSDERPFFTMKLVKGETLAAILSDRQHPIDDQGKLLGIFAQVCQTMAYAHSRNVIHRDLKPANIMVGAFGEVQVMDWGLAKVLKTGGLEDETKAKKQKDISIIETIRSGGSNTFSDEASAPGSQTRAGSVMGTPAYMPPEQALGEADTLDERADVFGLGAILCEILTGDPPYIGEDGHQVLRKAIRGDLDECYRRLEQCAAPHDLLELARDCLAPDCAQRLKNAEAVARRVTSHLESVAKQLRQAEIRRKLSYFAAAVLVLFVACLGGGGVWLQTQKTNAANQVAAAEAQRAEEQASANEELQNVIYASRIQLASSEIEAGNMDEAVTILNLCKPAENEQDRRGFEWYYLNRLCITPERQEVKKLMKIEGREQLSRDWRRSLHDEQLDNGQRRWTVFDTESGQELFSRQVPDSYRVSLSKSGEKLAITIRTPIGEKGAASIKIWDIDSGKHQTLDIPDLTDAFIFSTAICFSDDDQILAFQLVMNAERDMPRDKPRTKTLLVWNLEQERLLLHENNVTPSSIAINGLELSPDGTRVAVTTNPPGVLYGPANPRAGFGYIQVIDTAKGKQLFRKDFEPFQLLGQCTFSPDGKLLTIISSNIRDGQLGQTANVMAILDAETGQRLVTREVHGGAVLGSKFSPDSQMICITSTGELIHAQDGAKLAKLAHWPGESRQRCQFTDDGHLQTYDTDGGILRWQIPLARHESHTGLGKRFMSPNGIYFGYVPQSSDFGDDSCTIDLYQLEGPRRSLKIDKKAIGLNGAITDDGSYFAACQLDSGVIGIWEVNLGTKVTKLPIPNDLDNRTFRQLMTLPRQSQLVAVMRAEHDGGELDHVVVWELPSGKELRRWKYKNVQSVVPTHDGTSLAVVFDSDDKAADRELRLEVRRIGDNERLHQLTPFPVPNTRSLTRMCMAFSYDDARVAIRNQRDDRLDIWDLKSGTLQSSLPAAGKYSFIWSPIDDRIIEFDDGMLRVWDVVNGRQLLVRRDAAASQDLVFHTDKRRLISGGSFLTTHRVWDATPKGQE